MVDCEYVCDRCREFLAMLSEGVEMGEEEKLSYLLDCDICEDFCKAGGRG